MSIAMVGPFPGPFNRTHYSDSSSDSHRDAPQGRPSPSVPSQPQARSRFSTPDAGPHRDPRDIVPHNPAQPDSATPRPVYPPTCPALPLPAESQRESPIRPRGSTLTMRRCRELLLRLVAVGLATVVVGLLVMVVRHRGRVHPGPAPLKGANVVSGGNVTHGNGTASQFKPPSATAEEKEERQDHPAYGVVGTLQETRRGHREVSEARKALPDPSSTHGLGGSTTSGNALRSVPRVPAHIDEDESPAPELRAPAVTSAAGVAADIDTTAPALVMASTPAPKTRALEASDNSGKPDVDGQGSDAVPARRAPSETPGSH